MRRLCVTLLASMMFAVSMLGIHTVHAEKPTADSVNTVQLSEQQKKEMADLSKELFEKKKEVISKYVEYGVMTEEKGKKIISRMEKHYAKLEKNGFIPQWDKSKKRHEH